VQQSRVVGESRAIKPTIGDWLDPVHCFDEDEPAGLCEENFRLGSRCAWSRSAIRVPCVVPPSGGRVLLIERIRCTPSPPRAFRARFSLEHHGSGGTRELVENLPMQRRTRAWVVGSVPAQQ